MNDQPPDSSNKKSDKSSEGKFVIRDHQGSIDASANNSTDPYAGQTVDHSTDPSKTTSINDSALHNSDSTNSASSGTSLSNIVAEGFAAYGNMTLIDHLSELRFRLQRILWIMIIGTLICWGFSETLFDIVRKPITPYLLNGGLVFTSPIEKFMAHIKLSVLSGAALSAPFWLYQVWKFISPALYKNERNYIIGFLAFGSIQFSLGILFCYYVVFPMAFHFLMNFGGSTDSPMITIDSYLSFFTRTAIIFALTFQMPVIISFLGSLGVVSKDFLKKNRKYAIVIVATISAFAAPPDALSMILLLVPLVLMYELSIYVVSFFEKRKQKNFENLSGDSNSQF